jgi:hypothetical protein
LIKATRGRTHRPFLSSLLYRLFLEEISCYLKKCLVTGRNIKCIVTWRNKVGGVNFSPSPTDWLTKVLQIMTTGTRSTSCDWPWAVNSCFLCFLFFYVGTSPICISLLVMQSASED